MSRNPFSLPGLPSLPGLSRLPGQIPGAHPQAAGYSAPSPELSPIKRAVLHGITQLPIPGPLSMVGGMVNSFLPGLLARASDDEVAATLDLVRGMLGSWLEAGGYGTTGTGADATAVHAGPATPAASGPADTAE